MTTLVICELFKLDRVPMSFHTCTCTTQVYNVGHTALSMPLIHQHII